MYLVDAMIQSAAVSGNLVPVPLALAGVQLDLQDVTVQVQEGCAGLFTYFDVLCSQVGGLPVFAEVRVHASRQGRGGGEGETHHPQLECCAPVGICAPCMKTHMVGWVVTVGHS